ncbi:MAG: DUF6775 family putative metallopeptidase [Candidatus Desantisbacteria bacterium]
MRLPSFIHLYYEGMISCINIQLLAQYLNEKTKINVEVGGNPIPGSKDAQKSLAEALVKAKVINPDKEEINQNLLPGEIEYEIRMISSASSILISYVCDS